MIKYESIAKANQEICGIELERKDRKTGKKIVKEYAEVHERINAFRKVCPEGSIITEMIKCENGECIFKATVTNGVDTTLGTGHAEEKEGSSFINQTSYIENCETSAVGRALAMAGYGVNTGVASAEEVQNAELNAPLEAQYINSLNAELKKNGKKAKELEAFKDVKTQDDITFKVYQEAMKELGAK